MKYASRISIANAANRAANRTKAGFRGPDAPDPRTELGDRVNAWRRFLQDTEGKRWDGKLKAWVNADS